MDEGWERGKGAGEGEGEGTWVSKFFKIKKWEEGGGGGKDCQGRMLTLEPLNTT